MSAKVQGLFKIVRTMLLKTLVMTKECFYSMLTDIGEAGEVPLLAAFLFNFGEEL